MACTCTCTCVQSCIDFNSSVVSHYCNVSQLTLYILYIVNSHTSRPHMVHVHVYTCIYSTCPYCHRHNDTLGFPTLTVYYACICIHVHACTCMCLLLYMYMYVFVTVHVHVCVCSCTCTCRRVLLCRSLDGVTPPLPSVCVLDRQRSPCLEGLQSHGLDLMRNNLN